MASPCPPDDVASGDVDTSAMARPGVPVCLVTGFLGAGKTTLLNHILANQVGLRTAVFVNEFGAIEIDSSLIRWQSAIDEDYVVTLDNGCICCEVNADLAGQLRRVLREHGSAIDLVIIETSGVCNPGPVLSTLAQLEDGDDLARGMHLDCVLAVVDASDYDENDGDARDENSDAAALGLQETAKSQVASSDLVLLNKCDLVGGVGSQRAARCEEAFIQSIRRQLKLPLGVPTPEQPAVPRVIRTAHAAVGLALITGLAPARSTKAVPDGANRAKRRRKLVALADSAQQQEHAAGASKDGNIGLRARAKTFAYTASRPFDPLRFEEWLESGGPPPSICRAKGLLWLKGVPRHVVFQLAGKRTNPFETVRGGEHPTGSRIVFIGEAHAMKDGDDEAVIRAALDACLC